MNSRPVITGNCHGKRQCLFGRLGKIRQIENVFQFGLPVLEMVVMSTSKTSDGTCALSCFL